MVSLIFLEISSLSHSVVFLYFFDGMDLKEAEDIKKRWQEYTEELYKKHLHDPDNYDGVISKARYPGM